MKIEWLASAEADTNNIVDHLDLRNPSAARRIISRIEVALQQLRSHPFAGRRGKQVGTRELVVSQTPYIVVYTVEADRISIHHVLHSSQQWPPEDE